MWSASWIWNRGGNWSLMEKRCIILSKFFFEDDRIVACNFFYGKKSEKLANG